jgi:hypothetical protein
MSNADKSSSGRTRLIKAKTLAVHHRLTGTDFTHVKPSDALTVLQRKVGDVIVCETCNYDVCEDVCDLSGAFVIPILPVDIPDLQDELNESISPSISIPGPPDGYPENRFAACFFFPEACNATNYSATITVDGTIVPNVQYFLGKFNTSGLFEEQTGIIIFYPTIDPIGDETILTITASNECSSSSVPATEFGCFLEGSLVAMGDGSFKQIENVVIGDNVLGAFGETNTVLALHRPILGAGCIININNEHKTTAHHPHIAPDKKFLCVEPYILKGMTYGKEHTIIVDASGKKEKRVMKGVNESRIGKLEVGVDLQTISGSRKVNTLESIKMSPLTQLYHLVMGGSHTFIVDGYAVTGWADETDFNYDTWTSV